MVFTVVFNPINMKTFMLPFLFLGAVLFSSCTKETNEVVIPEPDDHRERCNEYVDAEHR